MRAFVLCVRIKRLRVVVACEEEDRAKPPGGNARVSCLLLLLLLCVCVTPIDATLTRGNNLKQFNFFLFHETSELSFGRKKTAWLGSQTPPKKKRLEEREKKKRERRIF